jgi:hypothetical protein
VYPADMQKAVLLESFQLNHGPNVDWTHYRQLELDPEVERQIRSRSFAEGIEPEDYIRQLVSRP